MCVEMGALLRVGAYMIARRYIYLRVQAERVLHSGGSVMPSCEAAGGQLNRVHFENRGYAGLQSESAPVRRASGLDCQTTISKVDAFKFDGRRKYRREQ